MSPVLTLTEAAGGTRPAPTTRGLQELVKALTPLNIEVRLANWYAQ